MKEYDKIRLCARISEISLACDVIISVVFVGFMSFKWVFECEFSEKGRDAL